MCIHAVQPVVSSQGILAAMNPPVRMAGACSVTWPPCSAGWMGDCLHQPEQEFLANLCVFLAASGQQNTQMSKRLQGVNSGDFVSLAACVCALVALGAREQLLKT
jgi:hypothetical protein